MHLSRKFSFVLISLLIFFSCSTEEETDDSGDPMDSFLGTWSVEETCQKYNYDVNIKVDPDNSSQVLIENFWLIGFDEKPPYAIITGSTITIPEQYMCYNQSNKVSGSGSMEDGKIYWDYSVNDGADLHECSAIFEK